MKKKILITGMSLNVGGAEKSLVNLLNLIDYSKYDVDLLLFQKKGVFVKQIPRQVNIVTVREIQVLFQGVKDTLNLDKLKIKDLKLCFIRYAASFIQTKKWKQFDQIRLHRWMENYRKHIPENPTYYAAAIAYAGGETAYYMIDKVKADRKVYYFHSDYSKIDIDALLERQYVYSADVIATISDVCKNSLEKLFPEKAGDMYVLNNLSSPALIKKLADEYMPDELNVKDPLKIVSVGRLSIEKGFDMAVEAANILKKQNRDFVWVVVGDGKERQAIEEKIREYGLKDRFVLVGLKENPYPYIKNADVILQPSRFEGKSVVLDEAKILGKPAILTNYNSAPDQVRNGVDGLIVEMSPEGIAEGINTCIADRGMLSKFGAKVDADPSLWDIESYMKILIGE